MPDTPSSENRKLRRELALLLQQARHNEDIMRRHRQLDLQFISAGSFAELIDAIFQSLPTTSDLDVVTLALLDTNYEIRRILVELQVDLARLPQLLFFQEEAELHALCDLTRSLQETELGPYRPERHIALFPEPVALPISVAIVPLVRRQQLIGTLNLGSKHAERFTTDMASDFIEHLASIVAICIENVINGERLKHIGLTDPLTGVNNRRYLERRLQEETGRAARHGHALSCLYIDIDHFKRINDSIGHQAGDEVLREVAARIKAELRLSDALGRFGGEEFVVLLADTELDDAVHVAERIRASVAEQPLRLASRQQEREVSVSIGVAAFAYDGGDAGVEIMASRLLARADQALYRAKSEGRNRVVSG
ncbi:MAG: sensor domain-containing diguanylate cyclase [Proteobacteria bacterium]|nr:sensor domain-containing diguanylate cyclase [Pseudomonadota bacterium]